MKYAARLRHTTRPRAAFQRRHYRQAAYYARHVATRRCQQNPMRWLCLWQRYQREAKKP